VVLRFGAVEITDVNHLINTVSMAPVGEPAEIVVWRDRREVTLRVTVDNRERALAQPATAAARPEAGPERSTLLRRPNRPEPTSSFVMGVELTTLDAQLAGRAELPQSWRGALVLSIDADSPLFRLLQPRDVISAIDNHAVQSADQAVQVLNQHTDHGQLMISVDRLVDGRTERRTIRVP
jgi:serine protease Do